MSLLKNAFLRPISSPSTSIARHQPGQLARGTTKENGPIRSVGTGKNREVLEGLEACLSDVVVKRALLSISDPKL